MKSSLSYRNNIELNKLNATFTREKYYLTNIFPNDTRQMKKKIQSLHSLVTNYY